jgi:hypothetical protein
MDEICLTRVSREVCKSVNVGTAAVLDVTSYGLVDVY